MAQMVLNLPAAATSYISFYQGELELKAKHLVKGAGVKAGEEHRERDAEC